jgi:hypothetical protein
MIDKPEAIDSAVAGVIPATRRLRTRAILISM